MASLSTAITSEKERLINEGFIDGGYATPDMNPGLPHSKVFYQASELGTYENFGGIEVERGDTVLLVYDTSLEGIYDPVWGKISVGVPREDGGGGSEVQLVTYLSQGVRIATMTIDGEVQDIYAPEGGGGGSQVQSFFDANPGILGVSLKPSYQYLGVNKGLFFDGYSTQIGPDFEVQVVTIQGIPTRVLHSRLPFYSDSFVSAGGLSEGSGTSGIDALTMWRLLTNNPALSIYDNYTKISIDHIPDIYQPKYTFTITGTSQAVYDLSIIGPNASLGASAYNYIINGLYVAGTRIKTAADRDTLFGINGISNLLSNASNDKSKIEWDATANNNEGAWHFLGNVYADGWISAGGISPGGGTPGIDLQAMWNQLTTNTDPTYGNYQIHIAHLTQALSGYVPITRKVNDKTLSSDITLTLDDVGDGTNRKLSDFITGDALDPLADAIGNLSTGLTGIENDLDQLREVTATMAWADSRFLTGNQNITLTGDVSGSGATNIEVSIGEGKVTNAMLAGSITNSKLATLGKFTLGSTQIELGTTVTTIAGLTKVTSSILSLGGILSDNTTESTITWDNTNKAWKVTGNLYATGFISAGGVSDTPSTPGIDLQAMWNQLTTNTDPTYGTTKINVDHIPDIASIYSYVKTSDLGDAAYMGVSSSVLQNDTTHLVTGAAVWAAIDALPEPMIFKGSLGTDGTIQTLPTASPANDGWTYKVITAGTYESQVAKVGDLFISNGSAWIWIPSGDEPSGTVTSVGLTLPTGLTLDTVSGSASPITSSGTFVISFTSGYSIPLTADVTKGVDAYNALGNYLPLSAGSGKALTGDLYLGSHALNGVTTIAASGLATIAGGVKLTTTKKVWFGDSYYLELVNIAASGETPVYAIHSNVGIYSDTFVSAGGVSSGGGTPGIDKAAMWNQLTTNTDPIYGHSVIHTDHIPDLSSLYQPLDTDLTVIAGLTGTTGLLKKTAANTWDLDTNEYVTSEVVDPIDDAIGNLSTGLTGVEADLMSLTERVATMSWVSQRGYAYESDLAYYGAGLTAASNDLSLVSKSGTVLSTITAANLVTVLGTTPVNRATGDADGNTIKNTYGAGLTAAYDALRLISKGADTLSTITAANLVTVLGNNAVNRATADGDGNTISSTYLKLAGGTMTGALTLKANQYSGLSSYGMNANNSDIVNLNAIYTSDLADDAAEGINFYRSSGYWDSLTSSNGVLYYYPNRADGTTAFSGAYTVYHSGNSNLTSVNWSAQNLTLSGSITGPTSLKFSNASSVTFSQYGNISIPANTGGGTNYWCVSTENSNTQTLVVTDAGNVGIGTTTPVCKFDTSDKIHVGGTRLSTTAGNPSEFGSTIRGTFIYSNGIGFMDNNLGTSGNDSSWIRQIETTSNGGYLEIATGDDGTESIYFRSYNTSNVVAKEFLKMDGSNGCIGINNTSPSYRLHVGGDIVATGAITAGSASDARLKTNVETISDEQAKAIVMALHPVNFTWNEKATALFDQYKGDDTGFIAQEVEPLLPMAVGTIFNDYKRLDATKIIPCIVKVEQDHETRIAQLEARVKELEAEIARLRS